MRDIGCPNCGALQTATADTARALVVCAVCRSPLERRTATSLAAALACASAVLLLLIPANLMPFLTTSVLGASRHSLMISSATAMWRDGWPLLSLLVGLFAVALPFARFALLTAVLGCLQFGARPPWLGRAFRWADGLEQWAMLDVFLLGLWVAYARLSATISVEIGIGCWCFIAAAVLSLVTRAVLDKAQVWASIAPDRDAPQNEAACSCTACELILPFSGEGHACPRCATVIHAREQDSMGRTIALTLAGLLFYIPANILPIATLPIGLHPTRYNVLEGVIDLAQAGLFGLALLVFVASFAIPFLKLLGLTYCIASVVRRSRRRLVLKTRIYRIVEEIGRWSMVDPFVIACFVPVMQYNAVVTGRAEPAAPAFATVVVLTMIAARAFDPRLMWDAARQPRPVVRSLA